MIDLIGRYEKENKKKEAKIIQKIINTETRRRRFQKITFYVGKEKQALKYLLILQGHHLNKITEDTFLIIECIYIRRISPLFPAGRFL